MLRSSFFGLKRRFFSNPATQRSASRSSSVVRLELERLEERLVLSGLGGVGAVGDSYTNEYQFFTGLDAARNWLEQLAEHRNVNFGAFSTTSWDSIRGPGYQYNWAAGSGANYTGQVAGLSSQIASGQVNTAVVMGAIGASTDPGDPKTGDPGGDPTSFFNYLYGLYNGTLTGSALSAVLAANVASRTDTLDALQAAGQQSSSGVNLVTANYANFAIVPQFRQALPDPAGRQKIVDADTQLNAQVDAAASARGVPVLDVFGLGQYIDQLTSSGQSLVIGGYAMDMTDYTPSSQEFAGTPIVPKDFWADEQHVGGVGQGLIANMFITAVDEAYGANIPLFSDQEILQNAGITPPPTAAPTYFDVSQWVIFPTPTLTGLSANTASEGSNSFTLTVNGSNFLSSSVVQWNGVALPTTFVSSSQLTVTIPAADLAEEGTAAITVVNPSPGGGASNAATFTITEAPLTAQAVNVSATARAPFNSVLATFTDTGGPEALSDYSATIAWGDPNNTSTTATIVANADGSFSVVGSFTYAAAGNYTIGVTITHDGLTTAVNAAMTVYANPTVVNTHDSGPGSLRQAILDANSLSGTNTISFDIPTSDPGYNAATGTFTIAPLSALPIITNSVILDGYTQPGANPNTLAAGDNAVLKIELSGSNEGTNVSNISPPYGIPSLAGVGLAIEATNSTVEGLDFTGFSAYAIWLIGGENTLEGNFIGTDVSGSVAMPNSTGPQYQYNTPNGSVMVNSAGNIIGGTDPGSRNIISGSGADGVVVEDSFAPFTWFFPGPVTGNQIEGNFLGTDATGSKALGNASDDVAILYHAVDTTVGGTAPGARNIISGATGTHYEGENGGANSAGNGVYIGQAQGTVIEGNYIGLDVTGARALGNAFDGVFATFSTDTTVGGTMPGASNVASGNGYAGVSVGAGQGTVIQGNFLGTDATGTRITDSAGNPLGNHGYGIWADHEANLVIGGTAQGAGNVISGNDTGIVLIGPGALVQGNLIGTDRTSRIALGNWLGIELYYDSSNNTIGGTAAGAGNVISGNSYAGILLYGPPVAGDPAYGNAKVTGNVIQGNKIGTDPYGDAGTLSGFQRNDSNRSPSIGSTTGLGNGAAIRVQQAVSNDLIGGTAPGTGNLIAYNSAGVLLTDENGISPVGIGILGNSIFANNSLGIDLGGDGVTPNHASSPSTGPNNWQNYPLLTSVSNTAAGTVISGTLNSVPNSTFRLEFFATPTLDASGNLEGQAYLGFVNVTTDANGNAAFTATVAAAPAGQQYITSTATRLDANGNPTDTSEFTPLPLAQILPAPSSLSGIVFEDFNDDGQVDFGEQGIPGVTITLTGTNDLGQTVNQTQLTDSDGAYVFLNLRPGNYYLTETQPTGYLQGIDTIGTAGGTLSATDQFFVTLAQGTNGLNYNFGEQPQGTGPVQKGQTATIGFWNNKNGQALINSFNGASTSTQLGDWLAATLPNMFGANAGSNDLAGKSNADIAALFQTDFLVKGVKLDAQILATALSVYATNATLDNTDVAANYGFIVSGNGLGTATVNVGSNGAAFGVADNSVLTVMDLLKATDAQAVGGLLYNGDDTLRKEANNVYSAINEEGDIG